jgi:putative ABC transport system permease protein
VEIVPDVRFALRVFARRPGVPLLVAALFALGVGLASGMWAVVDAAVVRPLPYRDGDRLVAVMETHPQRGLMAVTPANFLDWATRVNSLQDVAGEYPVDVSVAGAGRPERVAGTKVTGRFFDLWGVPPSVGRGLQADDFTERRRVVVLGDALWTRQFGADPRLIGASIQIDAETYTVIGVMPRRFRTVGKAELWIPWVMSADERRERRFHLVRAVGRLRGGASVAEAESELDTIYRQLGTAYPDSTAQWRPRIQPLRDQLLGDSARALMVLGGAVLVLVAVAWINVAGLLLAWLPSRRQEFVLRLALGATTTRLVRQLLLETSVWATAGLAAGLAIATWFVQLFGAVGVSTALRYDFEPRVDARTMFTTAALLLVSAGVTAVGPCVLAVRRSHDLVPRRASPTGGLGRRIMVATQVALSMVLLSAAAGLLVGFHHLSALATRAVAGPPTLAMEISRSEMRPSDDADNRRFFGGLIAALRTRGEIAAVAAASYVPPAAPLGNVRFAIEGRATSTEGQTALASAVSASAFRLLGIMLVRGRLIDDGDLQNAPPVAVISAALSRKYWPDDNPIGRRIVLVGTDHPVTVVGVVADVRQPLSKDPRAESVLYLSYQQVPWPFMTVTFVPSASPSAAVIAVREEVARLDSSQAAGSIHVLDDLRTEWLGQPRLQATVMTLFGLATLFLTLVGLYARVAHGVTFRAREFAIRQALGARPADVVRQLTVEALLVVAGGILAGLAVSPLSARALRSLVIDAQSLDFGIDAGVACLLGLCALASAYWPARRVGRVNPAELLRAE